MGYLGDAQLHMGHCTMRNNSKVSLLAMSLAHLTANAMVARKPSPSNHQTCTDGVYHHRDISLNKGGETREERNRKENEVLEKTMDKLKGAMARAVAQKKKAIHELQRQAEVG